jgi:glucokinase
MNASEAFVLAADIGGTNARFGLASISGGQAELLCTHEFRCRDHGSLREAVGEFLDRARRTGAEFRPEAAAFAVAGPVNGEGAHLPNAPWNVRLDELHDFGLGPLRLLNDFEALAMGIAALPAGDSCPIGPDVRALPGAPRVVVGAGTGFGVAAILGGGDAPIQVIAGEGGHAGFAPVDDLDFDLCRALRRRYGRVSIERVLSGPGLMALYQALGEVQGVYADPDFTPEDIALLGMKERDPLCGLTLARFCAIFGSVVGDVAMAFGARGGAFVAGGLANSIAPYLETSGFRERFEAKGRLRPYAEAIPTRLVTQTHAALIGAAMYAATALPVHQAQDPFDNVTGYSSSRP